MAARLLAGGARGGPAHTEVTVRGGAAAHAEGTTYGVQIPQTLVTPGPSSTSESLHVLAPGRVQSLPVRQAARDSGHVWFKHNEYSRRRRFSQVMPAPSDLTPTQHRVPFAHAVSVSHSNGFSAVGQLGLHDLAPVAASTQHVFGAPHGVSGHGIFGVDRSMHCGMEASASASEVLAASVSCAVASSPPSASAWSSATQIFSVG